MRIETLIRKEILEGIKRKKLIILIIVFVVIGIWNPVINKTVPYIFVPLKDYESDYEPDPGVTWVLFDLSIPLLLSTFVALGSDIITREIKTGSISMLIGKGVSRSSIVISKSIYLLLSWSVLYYIAYKITDKLNPIITEDDYRLEYYIDTVWNLYFFGIFIVALMIFFSCLWGRRFLVVWGVFLSVILSIVLGLLTAKLKYSVPTFLLYAHNMYSVKARKVTIVLSIILFLSSLSIFKRKQL